MSANNEEIIFDEGDHDVEQQRSKKAEDAISKGKADPSIRSEGGDLNEPQSEYDEGATEEESGMESDAELDEEEEEDDQADVDDDGSGFCFRLVENLIQLMRYLLGPSLDEEIVEVSGYVQEIIKSILDEDSDESEDDGDNGALEDNGGKGSRVDGSKREVSIKGSKITTETKSQKSA